LALNFGPLNTTPTGLQKMGCYNYKTSSMWYVLAHIKSMVAIVEYIKD
jgi:hypothetical protein